ncbi:glycosyltransferase family 9 protein [Pseudomonas gingeri]|uniref:Glycosyltransferase family 9 protein n=1 Tax=Pseudomonas gingeri TaxID=117681 RepID=A0A7Y8C153_9PSED|nr:glycosyltransferase family 9 protein [Pseudomonas gingeri]NWB95583.1 glycosyltransferase family 9 protein [Pseudomonas gingeri]
MTTSPLQAAEKILLVAPHRLGDTIFATPGIRVLRQAKPHAQIDAVALSALSHELLAHNSCINTLYSAEEQPIAQLAAEYDAVLPLQNINKVSEYLKDIPQVLMFPHYESAFHYSENFYRFVLQQLPSAAEFPVGPYELNVNAQDKVDADRLLKSIPAGPGPFVIALHMGCHQISKKGQRFLYKLFPFLMTNDTRSWSFKRFDQLVQRLVMQHPSVHFVLTGSSSEGFAADALTAHPNILNLIGKTNVGQLAAVLQRCQLVLTGDTGPMHVACAVERPMILLCGKTDPAQTGPYPLRNHHRIIQKDGMDNISVDEVYQAVVRYLPDAATQRDSVSAASTTG